MEHRTFWTRFFLIVSLLTAVAIFWFSAQHSTDSAAISGEITRAVARVVRPDYAQMPPAQQHVFLEQLDTVVRKCAHFLEFALLAASLACWLRLWFHNRPRRFALSWAWLIATLYAATDELHQMFVSGRGPRLLDVGIDSAGALAGVIVAASGMILVARRSAGNSAAAAPK